MKKEQLEHKGIEEMKVNREQKFDFYRRAALVCRSIPYGKAATYGQIALLCGKPKNARQVGYALRTGRLGEEIPAHRIVNARGVLSGAASFETADMQKILLEAEGVRVEYTEEGWRVNLKRDGWRNTMEEAIKFCDEFEKQGI